MSLHEVDDYSKLSADVRRACDRRANNAFLDVVERRSEATMRSTELVIVEWVRLCQQRLLPPVDERFDNIDDHLEATPFAFLPHMVLINLLIEELPRLNPKYNVKLYSPLVLRTSFIPTHMTLDTTALLHIFVDDIGRFKAWYYRRFNVQLGRSAAKANGVGRWYTFSTNRTWPLLSASLLGEKPRRPRTRSTPCGAGSSLCCRAFCPASRTSHGPS